MFRHTYVVCLCLLNDLQFVYAGQGSKRRPYGRDILQNRSQDCHTSVSCLSHPVAVSDFIICSGLCACTEML